MEECNNILEKVKRRKISFILTSLLEKLRTKIRNIIVEDKINMEERNDILE